LKESSDGETLIAVGARVHPVHAMNAEQRQMATHLWTKPTYLSHWPACRQLWNYIHHDHCHLLLLSPKADTHFAIPQRVEGWVDLDGWSGYIPRRFTCPWAVSHPSTNRAQCRLTTLIKANALTTTPPHAIICTVLVSEVYEIYEA